MEIKTIKKIYDFLEQTKSKTVIVYGGAGSGKSYTVALFLIEKFLHESNKHFLITRKTNPSLKLTSYALMLNFLSEIGVPFELNKSEQVIQFNKNVMVFRGMDDPEKIKSAEFNYVWMEEATEFSLDDYRQLTLRLRRYTNSRNQMYLTFNPLKTTWLYKEFFAQSKEDTAILKTNYKDNPFLSTEYIETLEGLKNEDETYYKIYALGDFASPEGTIYANFDIVHAPKCDQVIYGIDFGYNNPSAVLKIGIKDGEYFIMDEIYQTRLTNAELIERLKTFVDRSPVYADAAEPNRIEEIRQAGFNIYAADKSVKDGIDCVKRQKLHIDPKCVNTLKEIEGYKWRQDKDGNSLDDPVKYMDHAMDALRYALYTHSKGLNNEIVFKKYEVIYG